MNALRAILTEDIFKHRYNGFDSDEGIGFVIDNTLSYYDYIDFVLNESNHQITEKIVCSLCRMRGYEPVRNYKFECLHFSCYEQIKKVVNCKPMFHIKLLFDGQSDSSSHDKRPHIDDYKKEILLPVHDIISNHEFISVNGSNIEFYGVGYGRPCSYGDFHCMISNTHLSIINDTDRRKNYLVENNDDEDNTCCMCVEDYECIYRFNGLDGYCEGCIRLVLNIQTSILQKYMLFNEVLLNDITKHITMNILDIYESITEK